MTDEPLAIPVPATIQGADILVVDDTIESLRLLATILTDAGYRVRPTERPQAALQSALAHSPDLILLDVRMPEMSGFELCRCLKWEDRTRDIPIIFVSALQDVEDRVQGFEAGGVDFVSKPFEETEVLARVKTHLQLRALQLHLESLVAERTAELRKANLALGASEEKFRTVVEQATEGIVVMQNRRRKYYNPAMLEMSGYSEAEYNSIPFLSLVHSDDLEIAEKIYADSISGQVLDVHDIRIIPKSGNIQWVSIRGSRINWEDQPASMIFIEDITERKQAEAQLRFQAQLLGAVEQAVIVTDSKGRVIYWNPFAEKLYGWSAEEALGRATLELIVSEHTRQEGAEILARVLVGESVSGDLLACRHDGTLLPIYFTNTPIYDAHGEVQYVIGVSSDITERKQAEWEILEYQQRLQSLAAQMTIAEERERRRIAADLHDEVSQTLAFARIQLATAGTATAETRRNALLQDASQTLLQTIQATRSMVFELSSPLLNEIGLEAALTKWAEDKIKQPYGIDVAIVAEAEADPLDKDMRAILYRNVRELLTNVIKHADAQHVRVDLVRAGETIKVSVKDDGTGMEPQVVARKMRSGGGYGLFIIQERMHDLGGSLEIISEPGKGCTVILTAPLVVDR